VGLADWELVPVTMPKFGAKFHSLNIHRLAAQAPNEEASLCFLHFICTKQPQQLQYQQ